LSIAAQPPAIPIQELTMRFKTVAVAAFVAITLLGAGRASAAYTAYSNNAGITGLQNYGGALGLDFQVNSAITITALGAFNNGLPANLDGKDGASGITVGIFTLSGVQVGASAHFTSTTAGITQLNGDAFLSVTSFTLAPGSYSIVATNDINYNSMGAANNFNITDDGGGLIGFIGNARYSPSISFALPSTVDGGPADRYAAGTFQFTADTGTDVPEPASAALLFAGLGALALLRRRRA
jgi:hypothetical protein